MPLLSPARPGRWTVLAAACAATLMIAACGGSGDDDEATPTTIALSLLGRHETGIFEQSAAEIPAFDAASRRAFVVNAHKGALDVIDLSDPAKPRHIGEIQTRSLRAGVQANSVAVKNGIVAVAVQAAVKTDPGFIALYRASDLALLGQANVGALPDMLTFTPDGQTLLVANEGEPSDDYQVDPEGSVSLVDVRNPAAPVVRTADFKALIGQEAALRTQGVRIFGPRANAAQDFEPEYITVSEDGRTAWVALQENNALAKIDIASATVTAITALGLKDHGLAANGLDVTDTDGKADIRPWAGLRGLYLPDAIASYSSGGKTYIVTANEGDARAWGEGNAAYWAGDARQGFVEEFRVKHLVHNSGFDRRAGEDLPPQLRALAAGAVLNPDVFGYCGATWNLAAGTASSGACRDDNQLGRLNITWTLGYQTNPDGSPLLKRLNGKDVLVYDALYAYGGRSFSIRDENGVLVWDSGDQFEKKLAELLPAHFNSDHAETAFDSRSDNKGPEPEGLAIGRMGEKTYAFIGLERIGGAMVYDVSNPQAPVYVSYINSRDFSVAKPGDTAASLKQAGDLGPEGLAFVAAKDSPNGKPLLIVGHEVSGTTAIYQLNATY
ncbi:choice-of-anchor I family protein [Pseudorhodoferax sp. Leaf267]|uniref:choice-of-anchor I family protein n=1 Tax=Pseudorhodoferax sp. Leaf267 TaxID=1736316 RepID=UPI000AB8A79E|nr:choice-of-anchor I family protein [Pseudorhodoferax sp. Leaf267]